MREPTDYPYVRAWGRYMGSCQYYIDERLGEARADGAPANATHKRSDGSWATTDDIIRSTTRQALGLEPLTPKPPDLAGIAQHLISRLQNEFLQDVYGLNAIQQLDDATLLVAFSTGWQLELALHLQPSHST